MEAKVLDNIKDRWSPRAFSERTIDESQVTILLEAARWAPSSMNEQPWHYFYSFRGEAGFDNMLECLVPQNREWARKAAVLFLSVAKKSFRYNSKPNRHALHDTGASNFAIAIQAASLGMQAHQMGGFSMEKTLEVFKLSADEYEPVSFIAAGYPGKAEDLSEELKKRELAPRRRKSQQEISTKF